MLCEWPVYPAIPAWIVSTAYLHGPGAGRSPGHSDVEYSLWNPRLLAQAPNRSPVRSHGDIHPRNRMREWRIAREFSVSDRNHHKSFLLPPVLGSRPKMGPFAAWAMGHGPWLSDRVHGAQPLADCLDLPVHTARGDPIPKWISVLRGRGANEQIS